MTTLPHHHPTVVFDDDGVHEGVAEQPPSLSGATKRPRGRPTGSMGATTNTETLQSCDFYFLRACVENIDPGAAAERYLGHRGTMDRRTAVVYRRTVQSRMQRAINLIAERDQAYRLMATIEAPVAQAFIGPTLDQFAARFDEDMYTQAELIELYEEEYGKPQPVQSGAVTIKAKRQAIDWLRDNLAVHPRSDQPVEIWIDRSIAAKVRKHGVLTLGDLIDWINLTGRMWFNKLDGVGKNRARRVLVFLLQNERYFERGLSSRVRFPLESQYHLDDGSENRATLGDVLYQPSTALQVQGDVHERSSTKQGAVDVQVFGIVPLESLSWPPELMGQDGVFRSHGPNTYGAVDDRDAIQKWFETLSEKSPATKDSYTRSVERLVLWAIVERRCSLSSLNTLDFTAFRDFLRDPPAHWCSRLPALRYSNDWRPLRGPMADASVQATMSAVATLFGDLTACGYLSANAVASVRTAKRTVMRLDVMRSFSEDDLAVIRRTLAAMPDSPSKRRLRAILLLFQTSGMRRSEVANLTWGQIAPIRLNNRISDVWAATFEGKGKKERIVPLQAATVKALQVHLEDRLNLVKAGLLPYAGFDHEDIPVLSILDDRLTHRKAGAGDTPADTPRNGNNTGALSANRIYLILKAFFREAAKNLDLVDKVHGQADFLKASTHWLRHTFAHQALKASDRDIAAVQQILGHADISTTGLYVKADMTSRVAAVSGVVGFDV